MAIDGVSRVVVATDDDRIGEHAEKFGAEVAMTPDTCANGTERCAMAIEAIGSDHDIIVNFQGDSPLTPGWAIKEIVSTLATDTDAALTTPVIRCNGAALNRLLADRRAGLVGGTTAVFDRDNRALYFSKEVIPHTGNNYADTEPTPVFHHVGAYAYRRDALYAYPAWPSGLLERLEGLEQLRFLENGHKVRCVEIEAHGASFLEINNPGDVPLVEAALADLGID